MKKFLLVTLVLGACSPVYIPNIRNSPMFRKGGELQANVQIGNGIDGQFAVAFTNHIGAIGNYNYLNNRQGDVHGITGNIQHQYIEGGLGYFANRDEEFFEFFAGYGTGEVSLIGNYERYFIQPALGLNRKYIHVSFAPRISFVDFLQLRTSSSSGIVDIDEDPKVFFEPAVVTKVNTKSNRFYYTFQGGYSTSLSGNAYFNHRKIQVSMGLGIRMGGIKPDPNESRK
jgi:hypothetical protein